MLGNEPGLKQANGQAKLSSSNTEQYENNDITFSLT